MIQDGRHTGVKPSKDLIFELVGTSGDIVIAVVTKSRSASNPSFDLSIGSSVVAH